MKLYGLKNCDTCRKAEKALRANGLDVTFVDVRSDGVPKAELCRFADTFGEDLVNRRSTTWRNLAESEREGLSVALIETHPTLMKRPVIDRDGTLFLGWGKDVQSSLLG